MLTKSHTYRIDDLRWMQPARQERSQRMLVRLLDAAEAEIREKGFAEASVADIAARAGCSVGTFYRRFRDKGALMHALDARWSEGFRATMEAAVAPERWEGASILEILSGYLEFSLEHGRDRAPLYRAALEMSRAEPAFGERQHALAVALHERLRELLLARSTEIGHASPPLAVEFVLEQLRSMLLVRLEMRPLDSPLLTIDDAQFVEQALEAVAAYLKLEPPGGSVP